MTDLKKYSFSNSKKNWNDWWKEVTLDIIGSDIGYNVSVSRINCLN